MLATEYLLDRSYSIQGFDGTVIHTHAEAFLFNSRTTKSYGPSNFLAVPPGDFVCSSARIPLTERQSFS